VARCRKRGISHELAIVHVVRATAFLLRPAASV
jgi:hypothetical protein